MKNKIITFMALLVGVAMITPQEAKATTSFTCGDTISSQGAYVLNADVSWNRASNGPCLTVTVNTTTWTTIDCQNHTITITGGYSTNDAFLFSHAGYVAMYNCNITTDVSYNLNLFTTCINVVGSPGLDSDYIDIEQNTLNKCEIGLTNTNFLWVQYNTITDSWINVVTSQSVYVLYNTIDDTASANLTGAGFGGLITASGDYVEIAHNTVSGPLGSYTTGSVGHGVDDGILLYGGISPAVSTYYWVHHNTISGYYDLGVEWLGQLYHVEIEHNTIAGGTVENHGAFGCYFNGCFEDTWGIEQNTFTNAAIGLLNMGYGSGKDIYVAYNTTTFLSGYVAATLMPSMYTSGHPLNLYNNDFAGPVNFNSTSNIVDSGGNHCNPSGSYPSPLPITCTWP